MLLHIHPLHTAVMLCGQLLAVALLAPLRRRSSVCCVCGKERFRFSVKFGNHCMFAPTGCPPYMRGMVVVWATVTFLAKA